MKRASVFFIAIIIVAAPFVSAAANEQEIEGLLQKISALVSEIDGLLTSMYQNGAYAGIVAGMAGTSPSETIIDNISAQTKKFGTWCTSAASGHYGTNSIYSCGSGADIFQWIPSFQESAKYEVFMWWTSHPNRSTAGLVQIAEAGGAVTIKRVNQQIDGGKWNSLGVYSFGPGTGTMTGGLVEVSDQFGQVAADAVKFVKVQSTDPQPPVQSYTVSAIDKTTGTQPLTVTFVATLYNFPSCGNTFIWNFGGTVDVSTEACPADGTIAIIPARTIMKVYAFTTPGTYEVTLAVNKFIAQQAAIVIVEKAPVEEVSLKYSKLSVPTNTLVNGTNVVYRFSATASGGDGALNSLLFNLKASGADTFGPVMYVYSDSSFSISAHPEPIPGTFGPDGSLKFTSAYAVKIPAGSTRYFEVRLGVANKTAGATVSSYPVFTTLPTETLSSSGGTITPSITVISPNGGETWVMGESQTVKWSGSNGTRVNITLLNTDKTKEVYGLAMTVINDGSEVIKVPYDLPAGQYYLRVSCVENCSPEASFDDSNAPFSIIMAPTLPPVPTGDIIIDDGNPGTSKIGLWCLSIASGFYGKGSLYSCGVSTLDTYRWSPSLPGTAYDVYEVSMWWTQHANRSTNVPVKILANIGGVQIPYTVYVNQQANGGKWNSLGTFLLGAGSYVEVSDQNGQANADAVKFTKKTSSIVGSLSVSLDSSSPGTRYAVGGSTDQTAAVLRFHASNEAIRLTKLGVAFGKPTKSTDIVKYTLWDGAAKVGEGVFVGGVSPSQATLPSDFIIPKDGDKLLTIKVDLSRVGVAESGTPGTTVTLGYSGNNSLTTGVGQTSGTLLISDTLGDVLSSGIILIKSYPTLTRLSVPSNTLTNGTMVLYRFSASANVAGDIGLGKVTFRVSSATVVASSNFRLYSYTDSGFSMQAYSSNPVNVQAASRQADGSVEIYFNPMSGFLGTKEAINIPAGATRYFELRGDISGVTVGDSITVALLGDASFTPIGSLASVDATSDDDFIWSGNSTTTSNPISPDWLNSYALPGLPSIEMAQQVLSK